jgi:hypothetical protein
MGGLGPSWVRRARSPLLHEAVRRVPIESIEEVHIGVLEVLQRQDWTVKRETARTDADIDAPSLFPTPSEFRCWPLGVRGTEARPGWGLSEIRGEWLWWCHCGWGGAVSRG